VVGKHVAHALARALAPQRDGDALAGALQRQHVLRHGLKDVAVGRGAFGSKVVAGFGADIDRACIGHGEGRQLGQCRTIEA
jgi:hypothetical protein